MAFFKLAERTAVLFERAFKGSIFKYLPPISSINGICQNPQINGICQNPSINGMPKAAQFAFIKDVRSVGGKGIIHIDHLSTAPNDLIHNNRLVKNIVIDYSPQFIVYRGDSYYNLLNGKWLNTEPIAIKGKFMLIEQLKTDIVAIEHKNIITFPHESVRGYYMALNFDNDDTKYRGLCFINLSSGKIVHGLSFFNPEDLASKCTVDYNARLIKIGPKLYNMPEICSRRAGFNVYYVNGRYLYKHPRRYVTPDNYISNVETIFESS